jgi:hypothetical protein
MAGEKKKLRNMGRLSDAQDTAVDRMAERLSKKRGTRVTRADVAREALRLYSDEVGVEWPA